MTRARCGGIFKKSKCLVFYLSSLLVRTAYYRRRFVLLDNEHGRIDLRYCSSVERQNNNATASLLLLSSSSS